MAATRTLRLFGNLKSFNEAATEGECDKPPSSEDPTALFYEKIADLCSNGNSGKTQLVSVLNSITKTIDSLTKTDCRINYLTVFLCLRIPLVNENKAVRSAALRVIHHLLNKKTIPYITESNLHFFIAKCLDINLDNLAERAQVLRFCRKFILTEPSKFPVALGQAVSAIAADGQKERDRLVRASLAVLAELCVLNPGVFALCRGIQCLSAAILDCPSARMQESLVAAFLYLLNNRHCRRLSGLSLNFLIAPYSDVHYKHNSNIGDVNANYNTTSANNEDRDLRLLCAKQALLSVLRSWPGLMHFVSCGIMKDLVQVLYLPHLETRKGVLDFFYTLLRLPLPEWTDEFAVALKATDPSRVRDSWKLQEGFISAEGKAVLNHISKYRCNLVLNYTALLVYCLIEAQLPQALVEVIVSSDTFISVRATVLLGELLHLSSTLTPPACQQTSSCLPSLLECAASKEDPLCRQRAAQAVLALAKLHQQKQRGTVPCSLGLRQIIDLEKRFTNCSTSAKPVEGERDVQRENLLQAMSECTQQDIDNLSYLLRDSGVMIHKDPLLWNWSILSNVFTRTEACFYKLEDSYYKMYVRRVMQFYKPSNNQYCQCELNSNRTKLYTIVGCHLIDFLTSTEEAECQKVLSELLEDLSSSIRNISAAASAHDCLLSPGRLSTTACQDYFLLIGRLSSSPNGITALEKAGIFQDLLELVTSTNHECYLKLVASTLNYEHDGYSRAILKKILVGSVESGRLYATHHLRVLLRAAAVAGRVAEFSSWAVQLLINQLQDHSRPVVMAAVDVLDELLDSRAGIEALLPSQSALKLHLNQQSKVVGMKGSLLLVRLLSIPAGFKLWLDTSDEANPSRSLLQEELDSWKTSLNIRYVHMVESELADGLTQHQRAEDGRYGRLTNAKHLIREIPIPFHLYGQLNQHREGLDFLRTSGHLQQVFQEIITSVDSETDNDNITLKAAIWAAGHLGSSGAGARLLENSSAIEKIVAIAGQSSCFSLRGTAFFALNLIATTETGAQILANYGWAAVKKSQGELWSVVDESEWSIGKGLPHKQCLLPPSTLNVDNRYRTISQSSGHSVTFASDMETPKSGKITEAVTSTPLEENPELSAASLSGVGNVKWETDSGPYSLEGSSIHFDSESDSEDPAIFTLTVETREDRNRRANTLPPLVRNSAPVPPTHFRSFSESSYPAEDLATGSKIPEETRKEDKPSRRFSMETKIWSKLRSSFKLRSSKRFTVQQLEPTSANLEMALPENTLSSPTEVVERDKDLEESHLPTIQENDPTPLEAQRLTRIGSALGFLRSAPYKTRPLLVDQSNDACKAAYMGLCLPVHFKDFFPDPLEFHKNVPEPVEDSVVPLPDEEAQFQHDSASCIRCRGSRTQTDEQKDPGEERILVRKELLRLVINLGSSVGCNANEQGLLRLKQKFPWAFQDLCVFSDVCILIATYGYRLRARRFIQEIFADAPFKELYEQATVELEAARSSSTDA